MDEDRLDDDKLMSVPEVANILGVKPATVYALCNREKLEHVRVGRKIRITGRALRHFIDTGGARTGGQR